MSGFLEHFSIEDFISHKRSFLMGVSMISIMFFHQWWMDDDPVTKFFHMFGYLGVDIFIFLSGWGIAKSLEKNSLKQYYFNRAARILPTCIFVGILKLLIDYSLGSTYELEPSLAILTCTNLWYIAAIWQLYLFSPFFRQLLLWRGKWIISIMILIVIICQMCNVKGLAMLGISRIPMFLIGMYIGTILISVISKNKLLLSFIATLLFVCYVILQKFKLIDFSLFVPTPLFFVPCLFFLLYILSLLVYVFSPYLLWIDYLGCFSLELYVWHEYIYSYLIYHCDYLSSYTVLVGIGISLLFAILTRFLILRLRRLALSFVAI